VSPLRRSAVHLRSRHFTTEHRHLAATLVPDRPAVSCEDGTVSYGLLRDMSLGCAGWLTGRGLGRGDRIVIKLPASSYVPPLLYGASRVGVVFAVVHEDLSDEALCHVLRDAEPSLFIGLDPASLALARSLGVPVAEASELAGAAGPAVGVSAATPLAVDPVCLIYTSGSTGLPKAVVSTHQQLVFAATAIQSQLLYGSSDVVYCPLPLSFDYGMYQLFLAALAGAQVHLGVGAETGPGLLANLNRAQATVLPAVPAVAEALLRQLTPEPAAVPPLRLLTSTGAAMSPSVLRALRTLIPGLSVQVMFGLTECKRVAIMPPDEDLHRPGACGRPLPGTEVLVVGDHGERLGPGEIGEFVVRGPHVMAGYWRRPTLTDRRFRRAEGLFPELHTGDYGWLDDDGYLYFAGRRDDIYLASGRRVSATEVEAAVRRVPQVEAAAVLPPTGEETDAVLVAVSELSAEELLLRLARELAEDEIPGRCVIVDDLPLNRNGKVDKVALAASLAAPSSV
jgi:acyl-CoA synthetase (AMP-forming)/AMP-acid ligase II